MWSKWLGLFCVVLLAGGLIGCNETSNKGPDGPVFQPTLMTFLPWVEVFENEVGDLFSVNPSSFSIHDDGKVGVWMRRTLKQPQQANKETTISKIFLHQFVDCHTLQVSSPSVGITMTVQGQLSEPQMIEEVQYNTPFPYKLAHRVLTFTCPLAKTKTVGERTSYIQKWETAYKDGPKLEN